ncbi:MAG: hypothetical protein JW395_4075 [Nitrospira sp.]|nr:hypothetical protein [Nitrospira sp.]
MLLVVCAKIAGADDLVEVREWGLQHLDFLRRFLPFRDDIPNTSTRRRLRRSHRAEVPISTSTSTPT